MNDFVDIYCERLGPGFWAEPLNALTNIVFFIAAFGVWWLARREGALDRASYILIALLVAIGLGSFAFHTQATEKAQLADVIPILFYQVAFLLLYATRIMKVPTQAIRGLMFMFFIMTGAAHQIPDEVLNGSVSYFPALFFLTRFALWHKRHAKREPYTLPLAVGLFILSLTFRSLDMQFCTQMPLGLHFLWHLLNGLVLYLTARAFILNSKAT